MKIDRPGRYRTRDDQIVPVFFIIHGTAWGIYETTHTGWLDDGRHLGNATHMPVVLADLVEYIGPLEPGDDGFNAPDITSKPLARIQELKDAQQRRNERETDRWRLGPGRRT